MSIILKGIDIHEKFESTRLVLERNEKDGTIRVVNESSGEYIGSAIQIPKGYGRLIDGDALYKFFEDALNKNTLDDWWEAGAVLDNIELAPTILEAEESR